MGQPAEDMVNYTSLEDTNEKQTDEVQPEGKIVDDMQAPDAVNESEDNEPVSEDATDEESE